MQVPYESAGRCSIVGSPPQQSSTTLRHHWSRAWLSLLTSHPSWARLSLLNSHPSRWAPTPRGHVLGQVISVFSSSCQRSFFYAITNASAKSNECCVLDESVLRAGTHGPWPPAAREVWDIRERWWTGNAFIPRDLHEH